MRAAIHVCRYKWQIGIVSTNQQTLTDWISPLNVVVVQSSGCSDGGDDGDTEQQHGADNRDDGEHQQGNGTEKIEEMSVLGSI